MIDFTATVESFIACTPDDLLLLDAQRRDLLDEYYKLTRLRNLMVDFLSAEPNKHRWVEGSEKQQELELLPERPRTSVSSPSGEFPGRKASRAGANGSTGMSTGVSALSSPRVVPVDQTWRSGRFVRSKRIQLARRIVEGRVAVPVSEVVRLMGCPDEARGIMLLRHSWFREVSPEHWWVSELARQELLLGEDIGDGRSPGSTGSPVLGH
jgi:hypothetical protein